MDIHKAPKRFCENITIGFAEDYFAFGLQSGDRASVYALSPEHAKRLYQYLEHNLGKYEKEFGEIDATWVPGVKSPLQLIGKKREEKDTDES